MQSPAGPPPVASVRAATSLLRELLEVTEAFERSLGAELTVNPTDLDAMEQLIMSGPLPATELSRRLGISSGATTTVIDRLTALGHVHREPNPIDRRGVLVVANPASSAKAMARLMPMIVDVDAALDPFDATERDVITRYLEQVVGIYRRHAKLEPEAGSGSSPT